MSSITSFIRYIVYSNLFVSICTAVLAHLTYYTLKLKKEESLTVLVVVFSATYFIYNFHRIIRLYQSEPIAGDRGVRLNWIISHKKFLFISSLFFGLLLSIISFYLPIKSILILLLPLLLSILYVLPIVPFNKKVVALRDIPAMKTFSVALSWTIVTVAFPYFNEFDFITWNYPAFLMELLKRFLFIFAITLPFDIRDLKWDILSNSITLPQLVGVKKTLFLSELLLLIFLTISYCQYSCYQQITFEELKGLSITVTITAIIISFSSKKRSELFFSGLLEGTMLLMYLVIVTIAYV